MADRIDDELAAAEQAPGQAAAQAAAEDETAADRAGALEAARLDLTDGPHFRPSINNTPHIERDPPLRGVLCFEHVAGRGRAVHEYVAVGADDPSVE